MFAFVFCFCCFVLILVWIVCGLFVIDWMLIFYALMLSFTVNCFWYLCFSYLLCWFAFDVCVILDCLDCFWAWVYVWLCSVFDFSCVLVCCFIWLRLMVSLFVVFCLFCCVDFGCAGFYLIVLVFCGFVGWFFVLLICLRIFACLFYFCLLYL